MDLAEHRKNMFKAEDENNGFGQIDKIKEDSKEVLGDDYDNFDFMAGKKKKQFDHALDYV